jgi:hypothetical protein
MEFVDKKIFKVQMLFEYPEYISNDPFEPDKISISLNDTIDIRTFSGNSINMSFTMDITLPRQKSDGEIELIDKQTAKSLSSNAVKITFFLKFAKFFKKAVFNALLANIQNLSETTHMFILMLSYPANVNSFFAGLFPLVTFDMFPTEEIYDYVFSFDEL